MKKLVDIVTHHPYLIIAVSILVTVGFLSQLPKLTLDPSVKGMLPDDHPAKLEVDEVEEIFGGSEVVLIAVTTDDLFTPPVLRDVLSIHEGLEMMPEIEEVVSIFSAKEIKGTEWGMEVEDLVPELPVTPEGARLLRERVMNNTVARKNLMAEDGNGTIVIGIIKPANEEKVNEVALKGRIITLVDGIKSDASIALGGFPIVRGYIAENMQGDMQKFMPGGIALMLILLFISFGSLRGMLLPFAVVIMSSIWVFGLMALLGEPITFIGIIIPVMMIAIANDYGIHIVARFYEDASAVADKNRSEIVKRGIMHLGIPVMLAGITTIIGFSSLLTHPLPPSRVIGYFVSFGIAAAFLLSITFIPAWLTILPIPKAVKEGKELRLGGVLTWLALRLPKWKKAVLVITILFVILSISGIPMLVVDTNPLHYFSEDSDIVRSTELVNDRFGGSSNINLVFTGDIKDPEQLRKMESVQNLIETLPQIGRTQSLVDVLKQMNRAMHADSLAFETIPATRELVAQYMLLYSMSADPEDFDRLVDYDYTQAQVLARLNVMSTDEITEAVRKIEDLIRDDDDSAYNIKITGFPILFKELLPLVVTGQVRSLIVSIVLVMIVVSFVFRSVPAGLFAIVPISVAILMVFGMMGYFNIELNVATAMLSSILVGIGIDYTIHFIWRFREEMSTKENSEEEALVITLSNTGKGITYNALSVMVGFSVLMLSFFLPIYFFGWLLTFSVLACLIGAFTVLPTLLLIFKPKFIYGDNRTGGQHAA